MRDKKTDDLNYIPLNSHLLPDKYPSLLRNVSPLKLLFPPTSKWMDHICIYLSLSTHIKINALRLSRKAAGRIRIIFCAKYLNRLFHALRHVRQRNPEGLNSREGILKVQGVRISIDPSELHDLEARKSNLSINSLQSALIILTHLFPPELDLKVLRRLLRHPATKVQLVHLTVLVPHRRLVVHHKFPAQRSGLLLLRHITSPSVRLDFPAF